MTPVEVTEPPPSRRPRYFFSYAREDAPFALELARKLREASANVWLDQLDIVGGQRWDKAVEEALRSCEGTLVVLTPSSVASNNVMDEVSYALEEGKLVVPVLYKPCAVPFRLRRLQYVDFTVDDRAAAPFEELLRALGQPSPAAAVPNRTAEAAARPGPRSTVTTDEQVPRIATTSSPSRRLTRGSVLLWSAGAAVLGLWPMTLGRTDDPFLVNPLVIAGGLLLLAVAKPIDPQAALAFSLVPYVLNLWGMALTLAGDYLTTYYFGSSEFVVGLVAFAASLFVVRVICARRMPAPQQSSG